jgi:uncharacterized protein YkwD
VQKNVGENIATTIISEAAVTAWLKSASHKENIEGNFTFGIAIRENATGKKILYKYFVKKYSAQFEDNS